MSPAARDPTVPPIARAPVILGRVLSGLAILALTMDSGAKLFVPSQMIANSPPLRLPTDPGFYRLIGGILAICVVLYALPRTVYLGAVLLTGFLGGLYLRDPRLRALLSSGS